LTERIFYSTKQ